MAELLLLIAVYVVFMLAVVVVRGGEVRRWRQSLVTYELRFPADLDSTDVSTWVGHLAGLVAPWWQQPLAVRAVVVEITATPAGITHRVLLPRAQRDIVLSALRAALPAVRVREIQDDPAPTVDAAAAIGLSNRHRSLRCDQPEAVSAAILASMQPLRQGEAMTLQWLITPAGPQQPITNGRAHSVQRWPAGGVIQLREPEAVRAARAKQESPIFAVTGRVGVTAGNVPRQRQLLQQLLAPLHVMSAPGVHLFRRHLPSTIVATALNRRRLPLFAAPLRLNAAELTALIAWPLGGRALGLRLGSTRQLAPSPEIPSRGRVIGISTFPGAERPVAISRQAVQPHTQILGGTGVGKTTLLRNLIRQDVAAGEGVVVLDPHKDLTDALLGDIPPSREDQVAVLDPTDATRPVGLNVLAGSGPPELVVDRITSVMHALWHDSWGPRLDDVLRAAMLTLVAAPEQQTLAELPLILTDATFRRRLVSRIDDVVLRGFWTQFEGWSDGERAQAIAPAMNKLRAFLLRRRIRNVVGQAEPRFSFERAIAQGQVVLVPLSRGLLGEDAASLFAGLALTRLWQAIQSRAALPADQRPWMSIYLDEMSDLLRLPVGIADLLARARGFGARLTVAHQNLAQLPTDVRQAVLANCATRIVFQLGADDARVIAREMAPLTAADLQGLEPHEVAARLATESGVAPPVTARTLPAAPDRGRAAAVRERSRQQFGIDALEVEAAMQRRQESTASGPVGRRRG